MTQPYPNWFTTGLKWFSTRVGCWRWASVPQSWGSYHHRSRKDKIAPHEEIVLSPAGVRFTLTETISAWKVTFQPENITLAENGEKPHISVFPPFVFRAFDHVDSQIHRWFCSFSSRASPGRTPLLRAAGAHRPAASVIFAKREQGQKKGEQMHVGKMLCSELPEGSF